MKMNYELILGILTLIIALIAIIIQFRNYKKKQIAKYKGAISENSNTNKGFIKLLFDNVGKIIHLDIYFDDNEEPLIDKEGFFDFSIYSDYNNKIEAGICIRIEVKDSNDF